MIDITNSLACKSNRLCCGLRDSSFSEFELDARDGWQKYLVARLVLPEPNVTHSLPSYKSWICSLETLSFACSNLQHKLSQINKHHLWFSVFFNFQIHTIHSTRRTQLHPRLTESPSSFKLFITCHLYSTKNQSSSPLNHHQNQPLASLSFIPSF